MKISYCLLGYVALNNNHASVASEDNDVLQKGILTSDYTMQANDLISFNKKRGEEIDPFLVQKEESDENIGKKEAVDPSLVTDQESEPFSKKEAVDPSLVTDQESESFSKKEAVDPSLVTDQESESFSKKEAVDPSLVTDQESESFSKKEAVDSQLINSQATSASNESYDNPDLQTNSTGSESSMLEPEYLPSTSSPWQSPNGPLPTSLSVGTVAPSQPTDCFLVSVQGDATYCVPGPVCSGQGSVPAGHICPVRGQPAVQDCLPNLPSAHGDSCIAPTDATCIVVHSETSTWGCAFTGEFAPSQLPAPSAPFMENSNPEMPAPSAPFLENGNSEIPAPSAPIAENGNSVMSAPAASYDEGAGLITEQSTTPETAETNVESQNFFDLQNNSAPGNESEGPNTEIKTQSLSTPKQYDQSSSTETDKIAVEESSTTQETENGNGPSTETITSQQEFEMTSDSKAQNPAEPELSNASSSSSSSLVFSPKQTSVPLGAQADTKQYEPYQVKC